MIGWIADHVWAFKNRAALAAIDAEMDALEAWRHRLDGRMEELYGPDWREQAEKRLSEVMSGRYTSI